MLQRYNRKRYHCNVRHYGFCRLKHAANFNQLYNLISFDTSIVTFTDEQVKMLSKILAKVIGGEVNYYPMICIPELFEKFYGCQAVKYLEDQHIHG